MGDALRMKREGEAPAKPRATFGTRSGSAAASPSRLMLGFVLAWGVVLCTSCQDANSRAPADRKEVVFWHFWGGADREIVDAVVARFNESQDKHFVRAIAMPGSNLDLKLFLAITGGDPPDVVNQDDPIIADWGSREAILPISKFATEEELAALNDWLFPAARMLGQFDGELYALCNGLDVRALYYNATMLEEFGLQPPRTIEDLDRIAEAVAPTGSSDLRRFGFLPNPRNLWCWGHVFGGSFYDSERDELTLDHKSVADALEWMSGYGERYGTAAVTFRAKDQSLPGKTFPLLAGRYATLVDGQWRIRDIERFYHAQQREGEAPADPRAAVDAISDSAGALLSRSTPRFGVCPLPFPREGKPDAGWINGNFFVVPRGAKNVEGAWEFMKFWSGFAGNESAAAETCVAGGWIPVSQRVVDQPSFQLHMDRQPLWKCFIRLAGSANQFPRPNVRGATMIDREVRNVAERAMYLGGAADGTRGVPATLLQEANERLESNRKR